MANLLQFITVAMITFILTDQSEAAAGMFCSPVLPPPIQECRVGSISLSRSRELENHIKGNITLALGYLSDITNITACHPDYLSLNQSERVTGINPPVRHEDYTSLGKAVSYLRSCFYPALRQLEYSETLHHMDGRQLHLDTLLRGAVEHIASATSPLRFLVKSDPRLSPGTECTIPQVQCISQNQIHGTAGQVRFYQLWLTAASTWNYLDDLFRINYWALNNF